MISLVKEKELAQEFLDIKGFFEKIGFELVGTKDIYEEKTYFVKKKKLSVFERRYRYIIDFIVNSFLNFFVKIFKIISFDFSFPS